MFLRKAQDRQRKAVTNWKSQARERDISNGYWAGYHAAIDELIRLPNEEIERGG